jgi:hypothetical protein
MADRLRLPNTENEQMKKVRSDNQSDTAALQKSDVNRIQRAIDNPSSETLTPDVVQSLQSSHGNQFVSRLIQRMEDGNAATPLKFPIQAKMSVTAADDQYEQEADAVAQSVVQKMGQNDVQRDSMDEEEMMMKRIQRDSMDEEEMMMKRIQREEMDEEEMMQMKRIQRAEVGEEGGEISSGLESEIESARGGGQSLPDSIARDMGNAMGADLSGVNIHTGSQADSLNEAVQSRAFTTGNDIFMRSTEYQPETKSGQELLAHELTHTVQQGAVPLQSKKEDE